MCRTIPRGLLELPGLIRKQDLMAWLRQLPREIYRVKGFVRLAELPQQLHLAHKAGDAGNEVQLWLHERPQEEKGLVLLGSGLDADALQKA